MKRPRSLPSPAAARVLWQAAAVLILSSSIVSSFTVPRMITRSVTLSSAPRVSTVPSSPPSSNDDYDDSDDSHKKKKDSFEIHLGRALQALRTEHPHFLTTPPDYSLYDDHVIVTDPTGHTVTGLAAYKNLYRVLHALVAVWFCPAASNLTFRLYPDDQTGVIRVHWNAEMVPRFGQQQQHTYVDGISLYRLNKETGKICEHKIEQLLRNQRPVAPVEGIFAALTKTHTVTCPSYSKELPPQLQQSPSCYNNAKEMSLDKKSWSSPLRPRRRRGRHTTALSAMASSENLDEGNDSRSSSSTSSRPQSEEKQPPDEQHEALTRKNQARQKFGLQPLTLSEFVDLEKKVEQLALQQQQQQQQKVAAPPKREKKKDASFLDSWLGQDNPVAGMRCESNYDCQRPEVCCDFGVTKRCCSTGNWVG